MTTKTNYLVNPNATGKQVAYMDLADLFAPFVSGNKAAKTGFLNFSGNDLCNVFAPLLTTGAKYNFNTNLVSLIDRKDLSLVFKAKQYVTVTQATATTTQLYYWSYTYPLMNTTTPYWQIYIFARFLKPTSPSDNTSTNTTITDGVLAGEITVVFNLNDSINNTNQNGPVYYTLIGGGGGGGGGNSTISAGGGGGGGGVIGNSPSTAIKPPYFIPLRGVPYKITIGGGGAGGGFANNGTDGTKTRLFYVNDSNAEIEVAYANGGGGGKFGTTSTTGGLGGAGGTAGGQGSGTTGDIVTVGGVGGKGWFGSATSGTGTGGYAASSGTRTWPNSLVWGWSGGGAGGRTYSPQPALKGAVGGGAGTNTASGNNAEEYRGPQSLYYTASGVTAGKGYNGVGGGGAGGGNISGFSGANVNLGGAGGNGMCSIAFKIIPP